MWYSMFSLMTDKIKMNFKKKKKKKVILDKPTPGAKECSSAVFSTPCLIISRQFWYTTNDHGQYFLWLQSGYHNWIFLGESQQLFLPHLIFSGWRFLWMIWFLFSRTSWHLVTRCKLQLAHKHHPKTKI